MKFIICAALLAAVIAAPSFAQEQKPDADFQIRPTWILSRLENRTLSLSVWNMGGAEVTVSPKITVTRAAVPVPDNAILKPQDKSDTLELFIEFAPAKPGQPAPPAILSPGDDALVKVAVGKTGDFDYRLGDDFMAALEASGLFICRATYHGKLLGEMSFNEQGKRTREYDSLRRNIGLYTYDSTGKPTGQQTILPDDPDLRATLAAREKEYLAKLEIANANQTPVHDQQRNQALQDLVIFYTCQSLEFDKAANLQFALTDRNEIYNLKLTLALAASKTYAERNKKLEGLIQEFPEKKAFTENLMIK